MTGKQLREHWRQSSILKADWDAVLQSKSWKHLKLMLETEEIERAETYDPMFADTILARNLAGLKGARRVLQNLENACLPEPPALEDLVEFSHIEPKPIA